MSIVGQMGRMLLKGISQSLPQVLVHVMEQAQTIKAILILDDTGEVNALQPLA